MTHTSLEVSSGFFGWVGCPTDALRFLHLGRTWCAVSPADEQWVMASRSRCAAQGMNQHGEEFPQSVNWFLVHENSGRAHATC